MSVASEINRISQNISNALSAITNKGVTVPTGANSDNLASLIGQIETGSEVVIMDEKDAAGGIKRSIDTGTNKIKRIVKGTAPLSLTMVKQGTLYNPTELTGLTQYGKIEVIGTPSPTSPATIKCNNGTLTAADFNLPAGYRRVADLTLTDAKFVTNTYLTGSDRLQFSASGEAGNWIGAYNSESANDNYSFYASTNTTAKYLRYDGGTYNSSIVNDTKYDIVITPTGSSGCRTPETWTQKNFTCSVPMCIGATSPSGTPAPNVTFYGNIEVYGKAFFIPCERMSDNVLGYYELYNDEFFEDTDGGTVTTRGYDNTYLFTYRIVGTNEEITIGDTTIEACDLLAVGEHKDEQNFITGRVIGNTEVTILKGENQTWEKLSGVNAYCLQDMSINISNQAEPVISTHFIGTDAATEDMPDNSIKITNEGIIVRRNDAANVNEFKAYLASQIAAGTPVIVIHPGHWNDYVSQEQIAIEEDTTITMTAEINGIELEAEYAGEVGT